MNRKFTCTTSALLLTLAMGMTPSLTFAKGEPLNATGLKLEKNFSNAEETLEYHFMLKAPAMTEENRSQVVADLVKALKPILAIEKLSGPKYGAYIDSKERVLDKVHLILRLRPGQLTIKARSTSLNDLIDLQPCTGEKNKYERDFFEEPGFSISAEYKFKKDEWIPDPTKASVRQTMDFMQAKCPSLLTQLEPYLKPIESLTAPGTASMYSADIKLDDPLSASFKESGFTLWTFSGSTYTLAEIAWTGRVKDKVALEQLYQATREKLIKADLLAPSQSSKTEQYFQAYYGVSTPAAK